MSKKILVLYYSQSGQLSEIVNCFTAPFEQEGISIEKVSIKPKNDFTFPWTSERFFDAMPESVLGIPAPLEPFKIQESKYDLVIFAYQPWYLSPSIPSTSILSDPSVKNVLKDTPVITLIGARNMWLNAQEKVKALLGKDGARVVGNVALVDRNPNLVSAITILYWMMTGKKDNYLGMFPKPGISEEDVRHTRVFGDTVCKYLLEGEWAGMQEELVSEGAVSVNSNLMFVEERAGKLFSIWANLIIKKKNRKAWLVVFKYYLLFALFIVAPIVLTLNFIFFRPFFLKRIYRKKRYYSGLT